MDSRTAKKQADLANKNDIDEQVAEINSFIIHRAKHGHYNTHYSTSMLSEKQTQLLKEYYESFGHRVYVGEDDIFLYWDEPYKDKEIV